MKTSNGKRRTAVLIPYAKTGRGIEFFVQRRDVDAPVRPDYYGLWGGGIEGDENPEQAMLREIQEELDVTPTGYFVYDTIETEFAVSTIFCTEVPDTFADTVTVLEGQYGKFFTLDEIKMLTNMTDDVKDVLTQVHAYISKA